jgi:hypothetical protein
MNIQIPDTQLPKTNHNQHLIGPRHCVSVFKNGTLYIQIPDHSIRIVIVLPICAKKTSCSLNFGLKH